MCLQNLAGIRWRLVGSLFLLGGTAALGATSTGCVSVSDYYGAPASGLAHINLGEVTIHHANDPLGLGMPLAIAACAEPGVMGVYISESDDPSGGAGRPVRIEFAETLCGGEFPTKVWIALQEGGDQETLCRARDADGNVIDKTSTFATDSGVKTIVLQHKNGIRSITIDGSAVCIWQICWRCGVPLGTGWECVRPCDYYCSPCSGLAAAELGDITVTPAETPISHTLDITECSILPVPGCPAACPLLGVWIPNSTSPFASPLAAVHFPPNPCKRVQITLAGYELGAIVTLRAVDSKATVVNTKKIPAWWTQKVVLTSPTDIALVELEGNEICIKEICWNCCPEQCAWVRDSYSAPTAGLVEALIGPVRITAALDATFDPAPMSVMDCWGNVAGPELSIPWSQHFAAAAATIHLDDVCGGSGLPVLAEVTMVTDNAVLRAFEGGGWPVDAAAAWPDYEEQTLLLEHDLGIERIEIEGSQMCLVRVCWCCEGPAMAAFIRGNANDDGAVDIGDAIFILGYLFAKSQPPSCDDAADANDDGAVDLGDAIKILGSLFGGAGPLPEPSGECGYDPSGPRDGLTCASSKACE